MRPCILVPAGGFATARCSLCSQLWAFALATCFFLIGVCLTYRLTLLTFSFIWGAMPKCRL